MSAEHSWSGTLEIVRGSQNRAISARNLGVPLHQDNTSCSCFDMECSASDGEGEEIDGEQSNKEDEPSMKGSQMLKIPFTLTTCVGSKKQMG